MGFQRCAGLAFFAALHLCLSPSSVLAESPPADESEGPPFVLDPVEVIGERDAPKERLPSPDEEPTGFGTTLRRDDFLGERLDASDLLLQAPGVTIRKTQAGSTLSLRGASPDQTLVFLDGIRLTPAAGGGLDLRGIPVELLEEITILRGNEGARYGSGALGGVALLRTRDTLGPSRLTLSGGSFGTYGLHASMTGGEPRLQGLAAISLEQTEGDYPAPFDPTPSSHREDLQTERVSNNDGKSGALLLKGGARLGGIRLHGLAQGSMAERGLPGTLYFRDVQRLEEQRLLAALHMEPWSPTDLSISGGLTYRRDATSVWGSQTSSVISQPSSTGEGKPWQVEEGLEARAGVELAPAAFTLLRFDGSAGMEWLDSPFHGRPERVRLSFAITDELFIGSNLTFAPAIRYDRIGDHEGVSPKLGVSLRPLDFLELRGNIGTSFRVPSFGELYFKAGPVRSNPDLRPEQGTMVDGGAILRTKYLLAQVSAFYSRTTDLISYEIVNGGMSKPYNFLDAEVVGGEAEGALRLTRWLTFSSGYGMARTKNLLDDPRFLGKELPYRPAQRLFARMSGRTEAWEGFAEGHHQSRQWVNRSNTAYLPDQTWFRMGAGRKLVSLPWEIWLSAQADNLFDAYLVDQLGFPRAGRAYFFTLRASSPEDRKI